MRRRDTADGFELGDGGSVEASPRVRGPGVTPSAISGWPRRSGDDTWQPASCCRRGRRHVTRRFTPLAPGCRSRQAGRRSIRSFIFQLRLCVGMADQLCADSNDAAPSDGIEQGGLGCEAPRLAMDEFTEVKYLCRDEFAVVWAPRRISKRATSPPFSVASGPSSIFHVRTITKNYVESWRARWCSMRRPPRCRFSGSIPTSNSRLTARSRSTSLVASTHARNTPQRSGSRIRVSRGRSRRSIVSTAGSTPTVSRPGRTCRSDRRSGNSAGPAWAFDRCSIRYALPVRSIPCRKPGNTEPRG